MNASIRNTAQTINNNNNNNKQHNNNTNIRVNSTNKQTQTITHIQQKQTSKQHVSKQATTALQNRHATRRAITQKQKHTHTTTNNST